jgi:hypothetical protein
MSNWLRNRVALVFTVSLALSACATESNVNRPVTTTAGNTNAAAPPATEVKQRGNALVRVVDAIPGSTVDVFAGDTKAFSHVAYKTVTPYKEVPDDRQTFRLRPAGQESAAPLVENSEGFSAGKHYTVIALPAADGKPNLRFVNDALTPPAAGKAKVRVIHAAADAGEVDVYARGRENALFGGVNALSETNYAEIDPMTTTLEVRPAGQQKAVLTLPNAKFEAGKIYTIIVTGKAKGTPKLEAIVVEDQIGGAAAAPDANANGNANRNANLSSNMNRNASARNANAR